MPGLRASCCGTGREAAKGATERSDPSYVYLDYAATAPLCEEAKCAMEPFMQTGREACVTYMNPNSLSTPGRDAFKALEQARRSVACSLDAGRPDQVVFTSGATEADNAALFGIASAVRESKRRGNGGFKGHVVSSQIEHDAVLAALARLERAGFDVTYLRPNRDGFVEVERLQEALRPDTVLVSIQAANSETGAIQPVEQLAGVAHDAGACFHTDATQALGKTELSLERLGVDAASFSAHKVGGPKGVGALFLRSRVPFDAMVVGGGQESGRRSGTQNVAAAAGFAAACAVAVEGMESERDRLAFLRDKMYGDLGSMGGVQPTVDVEKGSLDYLPNIVNFMVPGLESETAVLRFDALGFAVSGGSACSSSSLDPSHVLTAMGIGADEALCEVRASMGRYTTREDVDAFLAAVPKAIDWKR